MSDLTTQPDLHQLVTELTRPHTQAAIYDHEDNGTSIHTTQAPALLDQLNDAQSTGDGTNGAGGYKSRPAAWLEPVDTLALIDREASAWVRNLGDDDPNSTKACVLRVHGLWASASDDDKKRIEGDVRRWWAQARVIAGWDSVAWRPDNTCPMCNERRSLRVKLGDQIAFCVDCRETWDDTNIGLLAEHIRGENQDESDEGDAA
jgi:hypothetical protein